MGNGRNQHQATHHQVKLQMQKFLDHMRGQKLAEQYYSTEQCWDRPEIDLVNLEELGKPKKPNFDVVGKSSGR